jgi:hypothetical protein
VKEPNQSGVLIPVAHAMAEVAVLVIKNTSGQNFNFRNGSLIFHGWKALSIRSNRWLFGKNFFESWD